MIKKDFSNAECGMRNAEWKSRILVAFALLPIAAFAQLGDVVVDGNGTVTSPANFWVTNNSSIKAAIGAGNYVTEGGNATLSLSANSTVPVAAVTGLGTAATSNSTAFATAAQGTLAEDLQSGNATAALASYAAEAAGAMEGSGLEDAINSKVSSARTISTSAPLTGGGNLTGNLTLAVSSASTNSLGVAQLATDAEIQTGTETAKTVRPSGLAAWWTWVKTQAQTIAGAWTFSGNVTVDGNLNAGNAPGDNHTIRGNMRGQDQTADYSDSYLTRQSGDTEWVLRGNRWAWIELHSFTTAMLSAIGGSASPVVTTSGVDVPYWNYRPNATADAASNYQALLGPYSTLNNGASRQIMNWSKRKVLSLRIQYPAASAGTTRYYWGPTAHTWAGGNLAVKGIGFEIVNGSVFAVAHDGSTKTTSPTSVALTASTNNSLVLSADGAGNVRWFVNGVEQSAITGGPTGNSGTYNYGFCTESINPTPAANTYFSVHFLGLYSEQ